MEQSTVSGCKFILMSYEGNGNHYWDTTFNLRVPFKPNSNGQYKVQINEAAVKNNEATLVGDLDYYELTIYVNGETTPRTLRFTCNKNIYTYRIIDIDKVMSLLDSTSDDFDNLKMTNTGTWIIDGEDVNSSYVTISVEVSDSGGRDSTGQYNINIEFPASSGIRGNINRVDFNYSNNWAYILNNMNTNVPGSKDGNKFTFSFYNIRLNGPYMYVLDTPLTAVAPTYNVNNQGYNIVALTYNTSQIHNSCIQMCSSMECVTNDLSNFRIRLLNDQYDPVKIREPIYVQITVSNEG